MKIGKKAIIIIIALIVVVLVGLWWYGHSGSIHKTDNTKKSSSSSNSRKAKVMNLDQIQAGDFSSLTDRGWQEVYHQNNQASGPVREKGGDQKITVTRNSLEIEKSANLRGTNTIDDQGNSQPIRYTQKHDILIGELSNTAVTRTVIFCPKGTTSKYNFDQSSEKNKQDLIVYFSSATTYFVVFAPKDTTETGTKQDSNSKTNTKAKMATATINLNQIGNKDLSSIVGTWKKSDGSDSLVITDQVMQRPDNVQTSIKQGLIISNKTFDGQHEVIGNGSVRDGIGVASIGYFANVGSAFSPITIVPAGVKDTTMSGSNDDSDTSRERLIMGGGQGGYKSQAYYRS